MPRKAKQKQPRLLPRLEPIRESDGLSFSDFAPRYTYACRCGHHASTGIKLESIVCTRCGSAMQPEDAEHHARAPPP